MWQHYHARAYKLKTSQKPKKIPITTPTKNTDVTFDMPNGQVMVHFFKLSGYHVVSEQSKLDHSEMVLGPFEILTNLVLDPLNLWQAAY